MSDIEVIEVKSGIGKKRNFGMSKKDKDKDKNKKRKRTSSGLIEKNGEMKGTETEFKNFVIDRTETPQTKVNVEEIDGLVQEEDTPSGWLKLLKQGLLGAEPVPEEKSAKKRFPPKKSCFNCKGEHNLSECPLPRNFRKIQEAKRQADEKKRERQSFHSQRIADHFNPEKGFKPGVLSRNLREALGIRDNDIPEHIYRMRRMGFIKGYPPGYLKKAIKNNFEILKIINIDSKHENKVDEKPPELDTDKMITYLGFNQHDEGLNDLEVFKIPPLDLYCKSYEAELQNLYKNEKKEFETKEKKKEKRKAAQKAKRAKNKHDVFTKDEDDDDVIIIDRESSSTSAECVTPGEELEVKTLAGEQLATPKKSDRTLDESINEGDSLFHCVGTPVFSSRNSEGLWSRTVIPSLDAFSVGIIPFEPKEESTENKGIFKQLMSKLKRPLNDSIEPELIEGKGNEDDIVFVKVEEPSGKKPNNRKKKRNRSLVKNQ